MTPPEAAVVGGVVRRSRTGDWRLLRGDEATASAHVVVRPDGRCSVSVDAWDESAYEPLLAMVAADLRVDLHVRIDEADDVDLRRWRSLGFRPVRRHLTLVLDVTGALDRLANAAPPVGLVLLGADAVDEHELRRLDDGIRDGLPGTSGWRSDPDDFREHALDVAWFDPATSLVAVDDARRRFAGLVRIWSTRRHAVLVLIGVTPPYRRRGLARAMLASALRGVRRQGPELLTAEVAETAHAALGLLRTVGARSGGATVELVRPAR